MLRKKFKNKGFTLIEIIVVIVILAVLMAVAVPSVMSYINEGNKAKYEAVARAAFINTQIAVAKDIAEDGKADAGPAVTIWVDSDKNNSNLQSTIDKFGSRKSYGSDKIKVWVTEMVLSGTATSGNNDLVSAQYAIALDGKNYRSVDVTVNGKMTVGDDTFKAVNPKNGNKYQFNQ
jgi:type IV pilus assembly protein PilA